MELIRKTEMKPYGRYNTQFGVFKCPVCGREKEMAVIQGRHALTCSYNCGKVYQKQEREKKEKQSMQPKECEGCGYWEQMDGCKFSRVNGYTRTVFLKGRTCREAGIYTPKKQRVNSKVNKKEDHNE